MLYLVGVNQKLDEIIRKRKVRLVRLHRGVYCDREDMADLARFTQANAVRIASYLYPDAVLMWSSARFRRPVECAEPRKEEAATKLFLGATYKRSIVFNEHLQFVFSDVMKDKEFGRFCVPMMDGKEPDYGPLKVRCASEELVFLMDFGRRRFHLERFLSPKEMVRLRAELEARHGAEVPLRILDIYRKVPDLGDETKRAVAMLAEPIEKFLDTERAINAYDFKVSWAGLEMARILNDGVSWSMRYIEGRTPHLQCQPLLESQVPAFISNLMPEGVHRDLIRARLAGVSAHATLLSASERYLSNVTISDRAGPGSNTVVDVLEGRLATFASEGVFEGRVVGLPLYSHRLLTDIADLATARDITRIPGAQPKLAMHLSRDGELKPATGIPATHILKFPGLSADRAALKGAVEWASMSLVRAAGVQTAEFAVVELPGDPTVLGYVTERFDVPKNEDDLRMIIVEDFCSLLGQAPEAKGIPPLEDLVDALRKHSTDFEADGRELFKQLYVSYLLENADFHAKNASVIKVANKTLSGWRSVRLAPAYDVMRTYSFAATKLAGDREPMQLAFTNSKGDMVDRDIGLDDWVDLAEKVGMSEESARREMRECAARIFAAAGSMAQSLPPVFAKSEHSVVRDGVLATLRRAAECCQEHFPELGRALEVKEQVVRAPRPAFGYR